MAAMFCAVTVGILPALAIGAGGYANPQLLIETEELGKRLSEQGTRVVDVRTRDEYAAGHVPGAVHLSWQVLDDLKANQQGFPIPQDRAEELFGGLGITTGTTVIAYDGPKTPFAAARLFFVLEFFGHDKVQVLNGGFEKWAQEGRPVSTEVPRPVKAAFVARPRRELLATADQVRGKLGDPSVCLLDARTSGEFVGDDVRAERGGRIPGAVNVDYLSTFRRDDHTLKGAEELRRLFEAAGVTVDRETITYCHTGARGAHDYFVLRLLGYQKLMNYDGSWVEWGNSRALPIQE
jgi:thiosulfate/3-mercaptopyruvate sulfurtransferase